MNFSQLLAQWSALVGLAALIAVIINVLKVTGLIKDGNAQTWSAGLNLAGLIALFILRVIKPDMDLSTLDEHAGNIAELGMVIVGYVSQLLASKATHLAIKNIPLIGTSLNTQGTGEAGN